MKKYSCSVLLILIFLGNIFGLNAHAKERYVIVLGLFQSDSKPLIAKQINDSLRNHLEGIRRFEVKVSYVIGIPSLDSMLRICREHGAETGAFISGDSIYYKHSESKESIYKSEYNSATKKMEDKFSHIETKHYSAIEIHVSWYDARGGNQKDKRIVASDMGKSEQIAQHDAIESAVTKIIGPLFKLFPPQIMEVNKGKRKIKCDMGSEYQIADKEIYNVYDESQKKVGIVKIIGVEPEYSIASILKGRKRIQQLDTLYKRYFIEDINIAILSESMQFQSKNNMSNTTGINPYLSQDIPRLSNAKGFGAAIAFEPIDKRYSLTTGMERFNLDEYTKVFILDLLSKMNLAESVIERISLDFGGGPSIAWLTQELPGYNQIAKLQHYAYIGSSSRVSKLGLLLSAGLKCNLISCVSFSLTLAYRLYPVWDSWFLEVASKQVDIEGYNISESKKVPADIFPHPRINLSGWSLRLGINFG